MDLAVTGGAESESGIQGGSIINHTDMVLGDKTNPFLNVYNGFQAQHTHMLSTLTSALALWVGLHSTASYSMRVYRNGHRDWLTPGQTL